MVVGTPGGDGRLDGFGVEAFLKGAGGERGEFAVRGEAERDELLGGEPCDVEGWSEGREAETLFEANDAVLIAETVDAGLYGDQQEKQGGDDPAEMKIVRRWPEADRSPDGGDEVKDGDRQDKEVEDGIEGGVALGRLGLRHAANDTGAI